MVVGNQSYQFLKNNAILCRCNCAQCDNCLNKVPNDPVLIGLRDTYMHMVTIRSEWVNLAMGSILIWELCDVFQCEYLAFYLAEMFKGTLCRKITFYILFNNYIIIFWRMSLIIYEKKSLKIMLTRLGIFNLTLSYQLSGKNYLKVRLTTQQLFFSHFKYSL